MKEKRISKLDIQSHYERIQQSQFLSEEDTSFILIDLSIVKNRLDRVKTAFGNTFRHAVAIKSNPLTNVLKRVAILGYGFECASFEEVLQAQRVNQNQIIIWDSPTKTTREIELSKDIKNLMINANDLYELKKIIDSKSESIIGLRVNPLSNATNIETMSVSSVHSKFGEPLTSSENIIGAFIKAPSNLSAIHVHVSSQNQDFEKQVLSIREVLDLALKINEFESKRIKYINIGGGFPASYDINEHFEVQKYADELRLICPELFDGQFEVLTEFGRYYHANSAVAYSRIENVKKFENYQTIINHLGADCFLRECYNPDQWPHEFHILRKGIRVDDDAVMTDIGGPLCFGGDYIAKNVLLPKVQPEDLLVIADVGANTFSLWSRHCSRPFPKILGLDEGEYFMIKKRELSEQAIQFWD